MDNFFILRRIVQECTMHLFLGQVMYLRSIITQITKSTLKVQHNGNYVISNQNFDGSWVYGELKIQKWIDSFHTGFILECISDYMKFTNDNKFIDQLDKGMEYYLKNFFKANGAPKYYNNSLYPIDIHSPAQLITTLYKTNYFGKNKNLANKGIVSLDNKKYPYLMKWIFLLSKKSFFLPNTLYEMVTGMDVLCTFLF